jgi:hypothetical protein
MSLKRLGHCCAADSGSLRRVFWLVCGTFLVLFLALSPLSARPKTLIVFNDPGGSVAARALQVRALRDLGQRVEIRGQYCLSSCTMYLNLPDVCITKDIVFGFHGPSSPIYGIGLSTDAFAHWSAVIADHYPEPLKSWYLNIAQNRTMGFHYISAKQIIEIGVPECALRQAVRTDGEG